MSVTHVSRYFSLVHVFMSFPHTDFHSSLRRRGHGHVLTTHESFTHYAWLEDNHDTFRNRAKCGCLNHSVVGHFGL